MQVNPDYYFCGAFTMTLWINPAADGSVLDFKDLTLANGYLFSIANTARQMSLISRSAGVSVTNLGIATALSIGTLTTPAWNFAVISFSGVTGDTPSMYASTTAQVLATSASITTPVCNIYSRAFIGNRATYPLAAASGFTGALNDLKICNFQMSLAQVQARWTAEIS